MECLFCEIINGSIPSECIYEDELVYAFNDIDKQAPIHFLIVPKEHIKSADELSEKHKELIGHIFLVAKNLCGKFGLENGYRIVNNCKEDGGQTVNHLHFHVLGGRSLNWPPG
ncbi:histidine triad nucleotide-binding protein [Peptoniphilus sp. oral taxon 386]|uniref:histidine triad nucleotide-binding protein n=1 Tax=Peptoniphilus sp. oral taxon 386 TaxID=652713 RepID=UPI0001DA9C15|nr:histidine triad nucleotide-binding protein [Peptoniphilus sp. oral taxon 386]EFI42389.1 histidine triad domain protein [Peptoniphilus sp. oral taxon 386 str. F0131]